MPYLVSYILYLVSESVFRFAAQHFAPIQVAPLEAHDEHFSGGQVGGDGDVLLVAVADGLDHLGLVPGVGGIGIGEQQHQVDLVVGDAGIDLLMTALLMGKQQGNGQTGIVADETAGGGSRKQIVLDQHAFISSAELDHQFLFLVVR